MNLDEDELARRGAFAAIPLVSAGVLVAFGSLLVPTEAVAQVRPGKQDDKARIGEGKDRRDPDRRRRMACEAFQ